MSRDAFRRYDAAYVLGALSPADRQAFEEHLDSCERCRRAVAEVAGLPGLLSKVDASDLDPSADHASPLDVPETSAPSEPVPDTLLPRLLGEVRRSRRRHRAWTTATAAAAASVVAAVAVGVATTQGNGPDPVPPSSSALADPARTMTPVGRSQLRGMLAVRKTEWGTSLRITCTYVGETYGHAALPAYVLVVQTRHGEEQVATWRAVSGKPTTVRAATALPPSQITSVEVRTTRGDPVLRLVT